MNAIEHGTRRGYQQHKARGGMVCEPCRDANNTYMREYQRQHYDAAERHDRYLGYKDAGYYDRGVA